MAPSLSLEGEKAVRAAAGHAVGVIQRAVCPPLRSCASPFTVTFLRCPLG